MVEESMIERGSHPHHEEPEIMPEFFGGEKLERKYWAGDIIKRSLGVRKLEEVKPDTSTRFGRWVDSFKTISDTELSPEFLQEEIKLLREIRREENLIPEQREQADKIAKAIGRKLKSLGRVEEGGGEGEERREEGLPEKEALQRMRAMIEESFR